jgi:hypothetical protein
VDQRRALERVVAPLAGQQQPSPRAQLLVDQWKQLVGGPRLTAVDGAQQSCHLLGAIGHVELVAGDSPVESAVRQGK